MSQRLLEVEKQALRLSPADREALAGRLMQSVDDAPLTDVDEAWLEVAERRYAAFLRGARKGTPAATAIASARRAIRR
jgi:hypothetical protein